MSERRDDLLDETVLRRSLKLEPDEGAPRFDAAALAVLAQRRQPLPPRVLGLTLAGAALLGFAAAGIWSSIFAVAPTAFDAAVAAIVDVVVTVATILVPIAETLRQPAVPLSLIAALGVAILYTLRERRERAHADAS
jgi:hypothetical protein